MIPSLNKVLPLFQDPDARDRILRFSQNILLVSNTEAATAVARMVSRTRLINRFTDTIPMLMYAHSVASLPQRPDRLDQMLQQAINFFDLMYYPFEHYIFIRETGLLGKALELNRHWFAAYGMWFCSLACELALKLHRLVGLGPLAPRRGATPSARLAHRQKLRRLLLGVVKNVLDLIFCGNLLPAGFLWAGRVRPCLMPYLALVTSIIRLDESYESLCSVSDSDPHAH